MTDKDIERLINKYLDGETTPAEECRLTREMQRTDIPGEWQAVRLMLGELALGEAEYDAIMAHRSNKPDTAPRQRRLWPWFGAVAAGILLLLVFRFSREPAEQQPVVAETIEQNNPQPVSQPVAEEKTENAMTEVQLAPQPARQPARKRRETIPQQCTPVEESVPAQAEPMGLQEEKVPDIPADKQALADIFFAEEALQVAYELSAQQEELRAYAASLTGQELPKTVIAF
ncbi:MAG: hypothetical protein IJQ05_02225 [Bacteroidaceae bacterium]|nr:hypothetical protein [Bacteroidaceae bacterium]